MMRHHSGLLAWPAVAVLFACGGNPPPSTPAAVVVEAESPTTTPALTDERALELGRGYAEFVHAGDFEGLWAAMSPGAREDFGTFDRFRSTGERIVSELGNEISVIREDIEPARAGMRASKLYFRVSHYVGANGTPVRLLIGLMPDGSIAGLQVSPAE